MSAAPSDLAALVRKPSAFLPLAMSLCAFALVWAAVLVFGEHPKPDEDAAAHLFQLLIAAQAPLIAWFLARWARTGIRGATAIAALQLAAIALAAAPVWYFGL